jgi:ABC-2 type transport system permease protein
MVNLFRWIASLFIRISAFITKEYFSVISQPRLLGVLILGPFLILLIFGVSYQDTYRTLRAIVVVPEASTIKEPIKVFSEQQIPGIEVTEITSHAAGALSDLENRLVDLVLVTPPDPYQDIEENRQAVFVFYHAEIDPFEVAYVNVITQRITHEVNRQLTLNAVEQGKSEARAYQAEIHGVQQVTADVDEQTDSESAPDVSALATREVLWLLLQASRLQSNSQPAIEPDNPNQQDGALANPNPKLMNTIDAQLSRFVEMDSHVMVEPFRREMQSLPHVDLQPVHFYIPAVLALLLQHMAVSLAGLSIVRERFAGTMELMRAAPVNAFEVLLGKYTSFLILLGVLAVALTALVYWGLGVPIAGSLVDYALVISLVILVSLGFGFLISAFARSDSQAIQFSMVLLLGSIFFSGFFLPLYRLGWLAQSFSWMMPATYGLQILQDIMLRGNRPDIWLLGVLAVLAFILFLFNWLRLHKLMVQS